MLQIFERSVLHSIYKLVLNYNACVRLKLNETQKNINRWKNVENREHLPSANL